MNEPRGGATRKCASRDERCTRGDSLVGKEEHFERDLDGNDSDCGNSGQPIGREGRRRSVQNSSNQRMILSARAKRLISFACFSTRTVGKTLVQKCSPLPNETSRSTLRTRDVKLGKAGCPGVVNARLRLVSLLLEHVERVVIDPRPAASRHANVSSMFPGAYLHSRQCWPIQ